MSTKHTGNMLNEITFEEHDGGLNAKKVTFVLGSNATIFTGVISASGNTTVAVPSSGQRFFIKNTLISSLGRSEVEVRSGATTIIPFTSLSTTGGYIGNWGEMGLPARSTNDALVVGLNGSATISFMFNVRFE